MRKQSEVKSHTTSLRMTKEQFERIVACAEAKNMTISSYILDTVLHADNKLTPAIMVRIQEIVNHAFEATKLYDPEQAFRIQKEVEVLWSVLK